MRLYASAMRKYLIPLILGILTVIWEVAVQFSTIITLIDKLRAQGQGGALMADLLLSLPLRVAFILAIFYMVYKIYKGQQTKPSDPVPPSPNSGPHVEIKPHIEVNPSFNQTQSQDQSQSQVSDLVSPKLNFECVGAKMTDVEVDISSSEILLTRSGGHALDRCMAAVADFRRNTDDSNIDSISIRAIAELKGRESEHLSINEVRWLEHDLEVRRSRTVSFERLDTKRVAVVLGISNRKVYTYEGRYAREGGGPPVFHVFIPEFQELTEGIYDVEIQLMGERGGKVIVSDTFGFEFIRGAELKDSIFQRKNPCLTAPSQ